MKILFHLNSMGRGGTERVVSILSSAFAQMGNEVIIAVQWIADDEYEMDKRVRREFVGLDTREEKKGRVTKIWLRYVRLKHFIKKECPDIVISFCNKANFRCVFAMLGMKIPLLVSVRNDPQIDYVPYKFPTKIMEYRAAGCVFQTPDARTFFSRQLQEKSKIILNPISKQYTNLPEISADEREKVIVTVGRIAWQKNQMLLLKSFAAICQDFPEYVLKLYGGIEDQQCYDEMKSYVAEKGLGSRIKFMGVVEDIQEKIIRASLFVLSSNYEGMPNSLMEAMVMGVPCIATDCPCGGAAMLVQNKISGILVPVGDEKALSEAMRFVLSDSQRAETIGNMARKLRDKVLPECICEEWKTYIDELVRG